MAVANIPVLTFVHGTQQGESVPLGAEGSWIAGRSAEADVVIRDDTVSRKHLRIYHAHGGLWLRDLGSRNGTHVNGHKVARHRLIEGDRITVGANLLRVEMAPASARTRIRPDESAGRSMSGSLQDIPLADVLQWLATSRKSGTLKLEGTHDGQLFMRDGMVVSATIDGSTELRPEKALLRMLAWTDGLFELDSTQVPGPGDEALAPSLNQLLMEAARQADELAHLAQKHALPKGDVALVFPPRTPWRTLDPLEIDLVQTLAGGTSFQRHLDTSPESDVDLVRRVVGLAQKGVVHYA